MACRTSSKPSGWLSTRDGFLLRDETLFQGRALVPTIQKANGYLAHTADGEEGRLTRPGDVRLMKSGLPVRPLPHMGGLNYLPIQWEQDDYRPLVGENTRNLTVRPGLCLGFRAANLNNWRPIGFRKGPQIILG